MAIDLILLLQSENVQVAILKTKDHVPGVLKEDINLLVSKLEMSPKSSEPYHSFWNNFICRDSFRYEYVIFAFYGNSANADRQVSELVQRNMEMLNEAERNVYIIRPVDFICCFSADSYCVNKINCGYGSVYACILGDISAIERRLTK